LRKYSPKGFEKYHVDLQSQKVNKKTFNSIHPTERSYKTNFVIPFSQHRFTKGTSYTPKRSYKTNFAILISQNGFIKVLLVPQKGVTKLALWFLSLKKDLQNMSIETLRLVLTRCGYNYLVAPLATFPPIPSPQGTCIRHQPSPFFSLNLFLHLHLYCILCQTIQKML